MSMIPVNSPQISVYLYKSAARKRNVTHDRFGGFNTLNLTPFLNEGSSVTTQRSINNPNGGFTIRLGDQFVPKYGDSIYGLVEPMDAIEIRMSRTGKPVMVMRGVVTDTSLDESMGQGPTRTVTISGNDYGAFLRMIQMLFTFGMSTEDLILRMSGQYMQEKHGIPFGSMTASDFVDLVITNVVNKFIKGLSNPALQPCIVDGTGTDPADMVYFMGFQASPEGTMWSHIQTHGNLGPFYELFFEDNEKDTTLVYRKPAFKKLQTDKYIFPNTSAKSFSIPPAEITGIKYSRSERDVANYYLVRSPRSDHSTEQDVKLQSIVGNGSDLQKFDYPNCLKDFYGLRPMEVNTNHGPSLTPGAQKELLQQEMSYLTGYLKTQIKYLQDSNIDNSVFESGTIRCAGRPEYKVGGYCQIEWPSGLKAQAYITAVSHTFEPYKGYTSTLQYSRGTGFVNRTNAAHPYLYGQGAYS